MYSPIYLIGKLIVIILTLGLVYTIRFALTRAFKKQKKQLKPLLKKVSIGLYAWLGVVALTGLTGVFRTEVAFPPLYFLLFIPPFLFILWLLLSRRARATLASIPMSWLIYAQSFRFLTDLFLWLGYLGAYVPLQMTFLWLNFDFTVGLTAPMAGFLFFGKGRYRRFEAILWNVFGIVLLVYNIMIAAVSFPSGWRLFQNEPSSIFLADFPFTWLIGFTVPLALLLHLLCLQRLMLGYTYGMPRRQFSLERRFRK